MASVHRKPGSKFWFAFFRDHTGKSTKVTARSKAIRIAERWEQIAKRALEPAEVRQATDELIKQFYATEIPTASLANFIESWFRLKAPEIAESTLASYQKSADKFLAHMGASANLDISLVRKPQVAEFRNKLLEKVQPQTANLDLRFLKQLFRDAVRDEYINQSPAEGVELVRRIKVKTRRAFTVEELRAVIELADPEWVSMIKFGFFTAQRLRDIADLTWNLIDLERHLIRFRQRKTSKNVIIPIHPVLLDHIRAMKAGSPGDPLHPRCSRTPSNQLSNQFTDLLVRAGLRASPRSHDRTGGKHDTARQASRLSFHSLRHTAATLLEQAGVARAVVQAITGHSSDEMSELYTHVGLDALQQATLALPRL